MMNIRLKRYKRDFNHSYAFGVFPTLELLANRSKDVLGVIAHSKGTANEGISKIQQICQKERIPFEFRAKTISRVGARENDFAIGVFQKAEPGLDASANHVILVNPSGMGNLGTITRTMLGFGFRDLAIIEPAADVFHPEVVRASMGALFQLKFSRFKSIEEYCDSFPRNLYALMTDGELALPETNFKSPFGLIFGPENAGLPEVYREFGLSVNIPQSQNIDSLNLAISVGITLYQARQRMTEKG